MYVGQGGARTLTLLQAVLARGQELQDTVVPQYLQLLPNLRSNNVVRRVQFLEPSIERVHLFKDEGRFVQGADAGEDVREPALDINNTQ